MEDFHDDQFEPFAELDDSHNTQRRLTPNEMLQQQMQQAVAGFQTNNNMVPPGSFAPNAMPDMSTFITGLQGAGQFGGQPVSPPGTWCMYAKSSSRIVAHTPLFNTPGGAQMPFMMQGTPPEAAAQAVWPPNAASPPNRTSTPADSTGMVNFHNLTLQVRFVARRTQRMGQHAAVAIYMLVAHKHCAPRWCSATTTWAYTTHCIHMLPHISIMVHTVTVKLQCSGSV